MYYADTSALVKLVVREAESSALRDFVQSADGMATSDLARTELRRAIQRADAAAEVLALARDLLRRVTMLSLTSDLLDAAGTIGPRALRSLDAIHLASAIALGDDLTAVITYDDRMAEAAVAMGLPVVAPA